MAATEEPKSIEDDAQSVPMVTFLGVVTDARKKTLDDISRCLTQSSRILPIPQTADDLSLEAM
jgi:hypothetical protein